MDLIVSALLALSAADDAMPARMAHAGRLAEAWTRSSLVCNGMTNDQVDAVIGRYPCEVFIGPEMIFDVYMGLGLVVHFDPATMRVNQVRRFSRVVDR